MICSNPIDLAVLADYWLGTLPGPEEETVEEHLLGCDPCGARLREVIALAEGVRDLARQGSLRMIVSDSFIERALEAGLHIRAYAPPRSGAVECTVTAEDDILVGRLAADFSGARRVDLCICDARGVEQIRFPNIPFHPEADSIVFQESISFVKAAPSYTAIARLVTFDEKGDEQLLGEYTFNHTRTLPGPGAW